MAVAAQLFENGLAGDVAFGAETDFDSGIIFHEDRCHLDPLGGANVIHQAVHVLQFGPHCFLIDLPHIKGTVTTAFGQKQRRHNALQEQHALGSLAFEHFFGHVPGIDPGFNQLTGEVACAHGSIGIPEGPGIGHQ